MPPAVELEWSAAPRVKGREGLSGGFVPRLLCVYRCDTAAATWGFIEGLRERVRGVSSRFC